MESRVSYTVIGLFVLVFGAAGVVLGVWLAFGDLGQNYRTYLVYMKESVAGLYVDAPVKYKGVEVGKVNDIEISPRDPQEVRLTLEIQVKVPIKEDTVAILSVQGLTGIAFVDLTGGSSGSRPLEATPSEPYPVIRSGPSLFVRLDKAVSEMLTNVNALAMDAHQLLNSRTRESIEQALAHIATLTAQVAKHDKSIGTALDSTAKTMQNTAKASAALPDLVEQMHHSVEALNSMAQSISQTSEAVRGAVKNGAGELQTFGRQTLPQVNDLLGQLQQLTGSLQQLSHKLQEQPQVLIYGNRPTAPGPGE
ncbi:MAG: MlaD family protein [Gammaproteobacteria bacterium]